MPHTDTLEARVLEWLATTDGVLVTAQDASDQIRPAMTWEQARDALDRLSRRGFVLRLRVRRDWPTMYRLQIGRSDR